MTPRTSTYLRRFALTVLFAGAATLSANAFGDPAVAGAEPREWDIGLYDDCVAYALADYQTGKSSFGDYHENVKLCCQQSGGAWSETQEGCVAPTGEQAQEAERAPVETAILPPEAALWTPQPPPPMVLYPGAISPGPASRG